MHRRKLTATAFLAVLLAATAAATWAARDPLGAARAVRRAAIAASGTPVEPTADIQLQRSWWDCGPAALHNLLRLLGAEPPALDSLVRLTGANARGTTLGAMAAAARALGHDATLIDAPAGERGSVDLPLIAWFDRRHFVVLESRDHDERVVVVDPEVGRYRLAPSALGRRWSGPGLRVSRRP